MKFDGYLMTHDTVLHLFSWDEKFFIPFRKLIREKFSGSNHRFIVYGDVDNAILQPSSDTNTYSKILGSIFPFLKEMRQAKKIILHGLFNNHLFYIFLFHPWLLRKCYWVIWGGDLYIHEAKKKDWRWKKDEWFRRLVISRIGHLVTYIPGDVELARKWYGAKGREIECLMYTSNVFKPVELAEVSRATTTILMGNSAAPSNNHFEIFEAVQGLTEQSFKLICPLSYGDHLYAAKVAATGKELFGERFIPLPDFMPYKKYLDLLAEIDVAVFAHRRQQGMGNMVSLLGLGKKVYMRNDISSYRLLKSLGFHLGNISDFDLMPLNADFAKENKKICMEYFSMENLIKQLNNVFEGEHGVP